MFDWLNKKKPVPPPSMPGTWGPKWDISGPLETSGVEYKRPAHTPLPPSLSSPSLYNYPPYEQYSDASSPRSPFFKSPRRSRFASARRPRTSVASGEEEWYDAPEFGGGRRRRSKSRRRHSRKRHSRRRSLLTRHSRRRRSRFSKRRRSKN